MIKLLFDKWINIAVQYALFHLFHDYYIYIFINNILIISSMIKLYKVLEWLKFMLFITMNVSEQTFVQRNEFCFMNYFVYLCEL